MLGTLLLKGGFGNVNPLKPLIIHRIISLRREFATLGCVDLGVFGIIFNEYRVVHVEKVGRVFNLSISCIALLSQQWENVLVNYSAGLWD